MSRPWSTTHKITSLTALSLLLACNGSGTPADTDTGSSSSSGTTQDSTSVTTNPPTTGDNSSTTAEPTSSTTDPGTSSSTTDPGTSSTTTDPGTSSTTDPGTSSTTGTSTTGTSTGSSSTTGDPVPSCSDSLQNQDETDIDCGGLVCPTCENDLACLVNADCTSNECVEGICVAATCDDLAQNGAETDVDCGGPDCLPCADDLNCIDNSDCASSVCTLGVCVAPACDDLTKNGGETDIDCGGGDCLSCADGQSCTQNSDCTSGVCTVDTCTPPSCFDSIQNGDETGVDCGGVTCAPCQLQTLIINEVDYDQPGTDAAEFIEIYNNTGVAVSLNGLEVRLVNGAANDLKVYSTIKLGNGMLAQGQYLVIAPAGFMVPANTIFVPFNGLTNQIQNGDPDGIALVDVPNKVVLDALSYGGSVTGAILGAPFPVTSLVEGMPLAANKKDNADPARSLARIPNGNDKNNAATDWNTTVNVTPGAANQP